MKREEKRHCPCGMVFASARFKKCERCRIARQLAEQVKHARTPKEKSVEAEITTLLGLNGFRVHKIDVIHATVDYGEKGKRHIKQGEKSQPDLIAVRSMTTGGLWSAVARTLYVECKRPGEEATPDQSAYHEVLRKEGFIVVVADSWNSLVKQAPWVER